MTSRRNIVILGGSYGGISTAHYALKHTINTLPEKELYQVVLISASSQAMSRPACPRALISDDMFPQNKLFVDVPSHFSQYPESSFRFVQASVKSVDHEARTVTYSLSTGNSETLGFYALVIATGATTKSPLMGFNPDETSLKEAWKKFRGALSTAESIVVAGGGPTSIETAAELGEYLNGTPGMFASELKNPKIAITVVSGSSHILPLLRPSIGKTAEQYLARLGVKVIKDTRVTKVEPPNAGSDMDGLTSRATLSLSNGKTVEADLFIPATGLSPNTSFLSPSLLDANSKVATNFTTLRVEKAGPFIYAIGDCSSYARPAIHNILSTVPILGNNLKRDLLLAAGKLESEVPKEKQFKEDTREMQLVPIGKSKGVGAAMGWKVPSFFVWLIKGRDYWLWTIGNLWSGKQWAKEA
ncbi:FAD/NAD(P)-binding domain-containing protein [Periconia macrospinosa]|uniref:FAD/NAD(P)-binding domain-containing protein n=1 Tax=Periconia macrospinosa TaxID=97972 RepID=A0A2V1DYF9_9PLEO|nr:FAD/NAD(P)-binding domain-containing protein [Periconia macrospinosa]